MAVRSKRVSDPLDDRVKDRIMGRGMLEIVCGSEHRATASQIDHDYSSSTSSTSRSLSYLVNCFEEDEKDAIADKIDDGCHRHENDSDSDSDSDSERVDAKHEEMNSALHNLNGDHFRNILFANVTKAIEIFCCITTNTKNFNRNVMLYLQNLGYNAAICETKWESFGGLTSGNHEFIDVIRSTDNINVRYFIDLNFAQEFDTARQTKQLQRLSNKLPVVFVGETEDLKVIVKLMCEEIRRSLKRRGLFVPPWRKNRFMQNKWFGPYRRTANYSLASSNISVPVNSRISSMKCSSMVGFKVVDSVSLVHAASRTR